MTRRHQVTGRTPEALSAKKRWPPAGLSVDSDVQSERSRDQIIGEDVHNELVNAARRQQVISEAAFDRYETRGRINGYAVDDWLAAEAGLDHPPEDPKTPASTDGLTEDLQMPQSRHKKPVTRAGYGVGDDPELTSHVGVSDP